MHQLRPSACSDGILRSFSLILCFDLSLSKIVNRNSETTSFRHPKNLDNCINGIFTDLKDPEEVIYVKVLIEYHTAFLPNFAWWSSAPFLNVKFAQLGDDVAPICRHTFDNQLDLEIATSVRPPHWSKVIAVVHWHPDFVKHLCQQLLQLHPV